MHAYWDDFWAIRAFGDAAYLAGVRGDADQAVRLLRLRDEMRADVHASLETTMVVRGIDYVPGSVEWADFIDGDVQRHLAPRRAADAAARRSHANVC